MFSRRENKFKNMLALFKSMRRWKKVKKLQQKIVPSQENTGEERNQAFEEYLDLCIGDQHVAPFMKEQNLTRKDLKGIFQTLESTSLGQWVEDHYAALTTIAYLEPLYFFVVSEKQGKSLSEITSDLMGYWKGDVPRGSLLETFDGFGSQA
ncbi:MAG: hypothetical protein HQM13_09730 [SAR324 cluster bacterium]|nr:hypothetical protein [SAR324 cluster bacterium]